LYRKESLPEKKARIQSADYRCISAHEYGSYKALLDFGIIDVNPEYLIPVDEAVSFFGNSSDLSVYDLGDNPPGYKTGDVIKFKLKYLGLAQVMNSQYIEKLIVN